MGEPAPVPNAHAESIRATTFAEACQQHLRAWLQRTQRASSISDLPDVGVVIASNRGDTRTENQDRAVFGVLNDPDSDTHLAFGVLCDGMGGMRDGGVCAQIAIASFIAGLIRNQNRLLPERIRNAIALANSSVFSEYSGTGGTTLVGLIASHSEAYGFSVGDSRLYVKTESNSVDQLSTDDTIAGEILRLKPEQAGALNDPTHFQLAQFVGIGVDLEPQVFLIQLGSAKMFLLTSDGVHSIQPRTFTSIISQPQSAQIISNRLIQVSRWIGLTDNSTVLAVEAPFSRLHTQPTPGLHLWDSTSALSVAVPIIVNAFHQSSTPSTSQKATTKQKELPKEKTKTTRRKSNTKEKVQSPANGTPTDTAQRELEIEVLPPPSTRESSI